MFGIKVVFEQIKYFFSNLKLFLEMIPWWKQMSKINIHLTRILFLKKKQTEITSNEKI